MTIDALVPAGLPQDADTQRRARLIVYATIISCLAAFMVFVALFVATNITRPLGNLLGVIPVFASTLLVLWIGKSVRFASHYFLLIITLVLIVPLDGQGGYSVLGFIAVPIAATHMLGSSAGVVWTLLSALWAAYFGPFVFFVGEYDQALSLSTAAVTVVVGLASSIVESTRAQAAKEAAVAASLLHTERARIRKVVQRVFPGLIDLEGTKIVYAGPGLSELVGYSQEEVLGSDILSFVHPDDVGASVDWIHRLGVHQTGAGQSIEARIRHKQGHWVWIKGHLIPASEAGGDMLRTIAGYDVTSERDDRARIMQAQRLEGIAVLAAGVAHDFNNLLTVITGFAELMEESEATRNILAASDDAATLVQKLMAFGKSSSLESNGSDVVQLVRSTESVLHSLLAPNVTLHVSIHAESLWVSLSASQLNQMLLNLVTNAKEAVIQQGGNVWIDVELYNAAVNSGDLAAGEYARITVSDDGCGMDSYTLQHAFDPFYTTKSDRSGTGLGLASVYGIARHAGGRASIEAEANDGTIVTLLLPLRQRVHSPTFEADVIDFVHGQGTVLVVEDDELIADLIARCLVQAGYSVTIKNNVESAWQHLQVKVPDLVVTDIMMPDGRGTDLASRVRAIAEDIPILFISGYSDQEIGEWKDAVGQVKFLAKPFRAQELLDRVGQLMSLRRNSS